MAVSPGRRRRRAALGDAWRDDGDESAYRRRLAAYNAATARRTDTDADREVAPGLRLPASVFDRLMPFQRTGVRWLWELHQQSVGGMLCDEMGLGKTIQIVSFLAALQHSGVGGAALVACPATVLRQWVHEFHTWWQPLRVALLHDSGDFAGSKPALVRSVVRNRMSVTSSFALRLSSACFGVCVCSAAGGVIITTYEGIRLHQGLLLAQPWQYIVLDEGHKIRNPDAEVTLACKMFKVLLLFALFCVL